MASLVHITPGDALLVKIMPTSDRDALLAAFEEIIAALDLAGVVFLEEGEEVNIVRFTDDELDALGLQRKSACQHLGAYVAPSTEPSVADVDKWWVCPTCDASFQKRPVS